MPIYKGNLTSNCSADFGRSSQQCVLATAKHNRRHFDALQQKVNSLRAEFVSRVGLPWNDGLLDLRNAVLDLVNGKVIANSMFR
jgi:hypothetical protein